MARSRNETASQKVLVRNLARYKVQKLRGIYMLFWFGKLLCPRRVRNDGEICRQTGPVLARWSTKGFGRGWSACRQPPCTCGRQYARYGILGHMSGCLMHTGHIPFVCRHASSHHLYVDILIERWLSLSELLVKDALTSVADRSLGIFRICGVQCLSSPAFAFIQPFAVANPPFV